MNIIDRIYSVSWQTEKNAQEEGELEVKKEKLAELDKKLNGLKHKQVSVAESLAESKRRKTKVQKTKVNPIPKSY